MYWEGLDVTEYVADLIVFSSDFLKFNFKLNKDNFVWKVFIIQYDN